MATHKSHSFDEGIDRSPRVYDTVEFQRVQALFPGYQIIDRHEGGSQATVFMASQVSTEREVAIKLLTQGMIATDAYRQRFNHEIDLISRLDHENIVTMYDFGEVDGYPYYIMQHVLGMPVTDHVFLHEYNVRRCVELFLRICDAISYAHARDIIHRDIKPANVIVSTEHKPYVLDFGLGKELTENERRRRLFETEPFHIVGTVPYMSPEQARGQELDQRSDQYSLGVLLYEMITDELPYALGSDRETALQAVIHKDPTPLLDYLSAQDRCTPNEVNRDLQAIVSKALRKEPGARYGSVADLASDFRQWLAGHAVVARSDSALYTVRKSLRRHVWPLALAAVILLSSMTFYWRAASLKSGHDQALAMAGFMSLGELARDEGRTEDARDLFLQALQMSPDTERAAAEQLVQAFNAHAHLSHSYFREFETTLQGHNDEAVSRGLDRAQEHCDQAFAIATRLFQLSPDEMRDRQRLAGAWRLRSIVHRRRGEMDDALSASQNALDMAQLVYDDFPGERKLEAELATMLRNHAKILRKLKRHDDMFACLDRSYAIQQKLSDEDPSIDNLLKLANSIMGMGNAYMSLRTDDNYKTALHKYEEAKSILNHETFRYKNLHSVDKLRHNIQVNTWKIQQKVILCLMTHIR